MGLRVVTGARSPEGSRRRFHRPRRRRGHARQQGPFQAADPAAPRSPPSATMAMTHHPHHQRHDPLGRRRSPLSIRLAGRSSCCSAGSSSISNSAISSATTRMRSRLQVFAAMIAYVLLLARRQNPQGRLCRSCGSPTSSRTCLVRTERSRRHPQATAGQPEL